METQPQVKLPQVISFLSGKGGAGKTSVAISVAYILNDAGFRVLLLDFDFSTHGASYFFKYLFSRHKEVHSLIDLQEEIGSDFGELMMPIGLEVTNKLYFLPSRVNFSRKTSLTYKNAEGEGSLLQLLNKIKNQSSSFFDFIIIDNQAGSSLTSKISAMVSDKVIIVAELDPISSDAVDTLLIEIGDSFPEYRRHLINKLDVREAQEYKNLSTLFQSMNRLPPLPFDFEVRAAFSSRRIPINVNEPTTFLIALFNTVKAMLPEYRPELEVYGRKVLDKFNEYQAQVEHLLDKKEAFEKELEQIRSRRRRLERRLRFTLAAIGIYGGLALAGFGYFGSELFGSTKALFAIIGALVSAASGLYFVIGMQQERFSRDEVESAEKTNSALTDINKELDRYKSLMLTRTKEFLVSFEP